jgi:hypothetical protein
LRARAMEKVGSEPTCRQCVCFVALIGAREGVCSLLTKTR